LIFSTADLPLPVAQDWEVQKPKGTLKTVDLGYPTLSAMWNYSEPLVTRDENDNWVPCLAVDWRWLNDRTIEFKLRESVRFHNGEKFNAEAVSINWEHYRKMKIPNGSFFLVLPDEALFEIIDEYTVRFTFPEPDGLAFVKFQWFFQFAPAFFKKHEFTENNYGALPAPGPWGTGPFKLVEGHLETFVPSARLVLEANEDYWDRRYPKVRRIVFNNTLINNREKAMRLCRETEGSVDIVSLIRPIDTLKVAESPFAKVVKKKNLARVAGLLNHRKKNSMWRDVRLRQALNYAVNREELRKFGAKGNAHSLGLFPPPEKHEYDPGIVPYTYDTAKARSLLVDAGYPDGFEINVIVYEALELEGKILGKMWERVGLKVEIDVLTVPEWIQRMFIAMLGKPPEDTEWDISLALDSDCHNHTAASFLTYYFLEDSNMRWIPYDPLYEEMWKTMARTVNKRKQQQIIMEMAKYTHDISYIIQIYSPIRLYAMNKEVKFSPEMMPYVRLKEASVTDNHWSLRGKNN
jgi:peptide/nickel transport system substrate-binding protein